MSMNSKASRINFPLIPGLLTYSALAMNFTRRGMNAEMMTESRKVRWLDAMITGPVSGSRSRPVTTGRHTTRRARATVALVRSYLVIIARAP